METPTDWSLRTWKERHENGYFPLSDEHKDWKLLDYIPPWFEGKEFVNLNTEALEIGCGYGEWMIPLSKKFKYVFGVDIHPITINKAAELFQEHKIYNAKAIVNNGTTLPFGAELFDLVYSISVFQHLPRSMVYGYLEEAFRVLRYGGYGNFQFRNLDFVGNFPQPALDIEVNHTGDFSVGWTVEQIKMAGQNAGFKEIEVVEAWDRLFLIMTGRK